MIHLYLADDDARLLLRLCEGRVGRMSPRLATRSWEARVIESLRGAMSRDGTETMRAGGQTP